MNGAPRRRATARARSARTRWASKSSSILILPIGEPMDETDRPCAARSRRDLVDLLVGQVQDVGAPGAAELDVGDAEVVQGRELGLRVGVDLVGEAGQGPHGVFPRLSDRAVVAEHGVLELALAGLGLVADLAEALVGQRVGDEHDHGEDRGGRRDQPEDDLDGRQRGLRLLGGRDRGRGRDVAAEGQGPRRRRAADATG